MFPNKIYSFIISTMLNNSTNIYQKKFLFPLWYTVILFCTVQVGLFICLVKERQNRQNIGHLRKENFRGVLVVFFFFLPGNFFSTQYLWQYKVKGEPYKYQSLLLGLKEYLSKRFITHQVYYTSECWYLSLLLSGLWFWVLMF